MKRVWGFICGVFEIFRWASTLVVLLALSWYGVLVFQQKTWAPAVPQVVATWWPLKTQELKADHAADLLQIDRVVEDFNQITSRHRRFVEENARLQTENSILRDAVGSLEEADTKRKEALDKLKALPK